METVQRDFSPKGVKFYYIYKALAHPETNGYVTPFDLKERLMHVEEAKRTLDTRIEWICDTMDNDLKHALGDRPNSEFVIDPDGKIVVSRSWSDPDALRKDLAELVGPVDRETKIADLDMQRLEPPSRAQTGVVPRVKVPGQMSPLITEPQQSDKPFYAKLRAESNNNDLYLGFFLDPLYEVHWNNRAPVLEYKIVPPAGVTVTPTSGVGPEVEADADSDPREFLFKLSGQSDQPLRVTVKYFACDDAETFCIPVTQEYLVYLQRDQDGGNRRVPNGGRRVTQAPSGNQRMPAQLGDMLRRMPLMMALDVNRDGTISQREQSAAPKSLLRLDVNRDGDLTVDELRPRRGRAPAR